MSVQPCRCIEDGPQHCPQHMGGAAERPAPEKICGALAVVLKARHSRKDKFTYKLITDEELDVIEAALRGAL